MLGCGPEVARRLGARPSYVFDIHNGGCAAFMHMMALARTILQTTDARTALIAATQNCAGPVFTQTEVRKLAQAPVPGDGCGVGLLVRDDSAPILDTECRTYPEFAGDMEFSTNGSRKYWEPGEGQACVSFSEAKVTKVFTRGNRLVPEVALAVCDRIGVKGRDIDTFVTNQPNRLFLRNWHDALELPAERHPDTFDQCGNLFAAGIPITLDVENRAGRLRTGSVVLMSAFAHAGDFAAARRCAGELLDEHATGRRHQTVQAARAEPRQARFDLSLSENPCLPLSSVLLAINHVLAQANRYPEYLPIQLPALIARHVGVQAEQVVVGSGATGVAMQILRALAKSGSGIVYGAPTFDGYPIMAEMADLDLVPIPLDAAANQDLRAMARSVHKQTGLVVLCPPHNPTGTVIPAGELRWFLRAVPTRVPVLLDEAYVEFLAAADQEPYS